MFSHLYRLPRPTLIARTEVSAQLLPPARVGRIAARAIEGKHAIDDWGTKVLNHSLFQHCELTVGRLAELLIHNRVTCVDLELDSVDREGEPAGHIIRFGSVVGEEQRKEGAV